MPTAKDIRPSPEQRAFLESDARMRCFAGGIGTGKTTASVLAALKAAEKAKRGMMVAPNYTMVEQPLMAETEELAREVRGGVQRIKRSPPPEMVLANGTKILFRSADKPDTLRGPNIGFLGVDEAAMISKEAWKILIGRVRIPPEKIWATTTPRGYNWVYETFVEGVQKEQSEFDLSPKLKKPNKYWVQASTEDAPWLSEAFVQSIKEDYSEKLWRQEGLGEFIQLGGAAFQKSDLRHGPLPENLGNVVVGVDPAGGGKDEIGIVTCARKGDMYFVLEDATCTGRPSTWAGVAVRQWKKWNADKIVAERQYGGEMVKEVLSGIDPTVPVDDVPAVQGKRLRADPVIAKYEEGDVIHWEEANLTKLERQMTTWDPDSNTSPDRVEGMVYAIRSLIKADPVVDSEILFV